MNVVTIKNLGNRTADIASWQFCSSCSYILLGNTSQVSVVSGSLNLARGAEVSMEFMNTNYLDSGADDLALYTQGSFLDPNKMVDYVVWLTTEGCRESVAVLKGIWTDNLPVSGGGPYVYTGDGTEVGPRNEFWFTDMFNIRLASVDPVSNEIVITNFGTVSADVSTWWLCSECDYYRLDASAQVSVVAGSLNVEAKGSVTVAVTVTNFLNGLPFSDDVALFDSPDTDSTTSMIDFMQYGAAGGCSEGLAVAKGIWSTVAFASGLTPFQFTGTGLEVGPRNPFWSGLNLSISLTSIAPRSDGAIDLVYSTVPGRLYQIRYTDDQKVWMNSALQLLAPTNTFAITDIGPPLTSSHPNTRNQRGYAVSDVTP